MKSFGATLIALFPVFIAVGSTPVKECRHSLPIPYLYLSCHRSVLMNAKYFLADAPSTPRDGNIASRHVTSIIITTVAGRSHVSIAWLRSLNNVAKCVVWRRAIPVKLARLKGVRCRERKEMELDGWARSRLPVLHIAERSYVWGLR